jgi:hypothetical protein
MTDEKFLELVPEKICKHEEHEGKVTVLFIKTPTFIEKMFFKKLINKPYKIDLDEIGSFIWNIIDGKKNIAEIVALAKENFGEKIEPAENRTVQFMKQMHSTKLIMLYKKETESN